MNAEEAEEASALAEKAKLDAYYAAVVVRKGRDLYFKLLDCIPQDVLRNYLEERYGL